MGFSCRYTFNSEMTDVSPLTRVLEGNCAYVSLGVNVKNCVFIEVFRFGNVTITELKL